MTTVCLAVMAKDEAHVIAGCLQSARPLVDSWVVLDTGSTDAARDVAREAMLGVPGEVIDRPWRGFGESRTESLELARSRADYVLVLDADDRLEFPAGARFPPLTESAYALAVYHGSFQFRRLHLFASALPWRYEGACHEFALCEGASEPGFVDGIRYLAVGGGARSRDPQRYLNDAALLEADLQRDPTNARTIFYLGRSYEDAGDLPRALAHYERRAKLGGWDEEVFYATFAAARVRERLGLPRDVVARGYLEAWHLRPQRAEPLYELARLARLAQDWRRARAFANAAVALPLPQRGRALRGSGDVRLARPQRVRWGLGLPWRYARGDQRAAHDARWREATGRRAEARRRGEPRAVRGRCHPHPQSAR